jgi:Beta-xylosidase
MGINPILRLDYPDPDIIRVGDTYYMVSTTMHFMPGCEILKSHDLVNWEHLTYVYEKIDSTKAQRLVEDEQIYGKGMWAATIRYHQEMFYICFVANDTQKTYLYRAKDISGPWKKSVISGFYHDASLLFDNDRVFIVFGNTDIELLELKRDMSGPKKNGLYRVIVSEKDNEFLGYEGAHLYKINNKYYLFLIHSRKDRWQRIEALYVADSLEAEFIGKDVLDDDRGYCGQGVAQGGIVDTPDGKWYAILFQDSGAVGRIPILVPIRWENDWPIFGNAGKIPEVFEVTSNKPEYQYRQLVGSDDFTEAKLKPRWQFNHEPQIGRWGINTKEKTFWIQTDKICENLLQARNTLTQRMYYPRCSGEVIVDGGNLNDGDYAGLCALQGCYGIIAIYREKEQYKIVMKERPADDSSVAAMPVKVVETKQESIDINASVVRLKVEVDFENMKDEARFFYWDSKAWVQIGCTKKLYFKIDHFTGCRFGLFAYSTKEVGGKARFREFKYQY